MRSEEIGRSGQTQYTDNWGLRFGSTSRALHSRVRLEDYDAADSVNAIRSKPAAELLPGQPATGRSYRRVAGVSTRLTAQDCGPCGSKEYAKYMTGNWPTNARDHQVELFFPQSGRLARKGLNRERGSVVNPTTTPNLTLALATREGNTNALRWPA